ncbi:similar to Saccharomyces cerevisiae YOR350C MNE1 Mitochondrial matrix protein involved in splicing Group I aI5-beta intron from COX1 mRNA [Maudiozyma saulgeensis]|uniref:Similar to Saccharomyces cerevisiae YOR350C MNE1 Mitochondrial matrix protein involved in splicing Group I aI5-beta intron from COX1 mRNA n=1 Tax=Maudiozyma saulgeensis TaxID=1789683 RepID=A0A1X7R4V1_9SACH|nr:similar to Saccharomyces cerevisiae YOR350C MNE1 Mitochondrial matrix protein involved in splicing Group I aI5-beta intron from COX1 mRNA [Kazachstania saulgeensis]
MNRVIKRYITGNLEKTLYDAFVADTRSLNKSSKLYSPQNIFNNKSEGVRSSKNYQKNRTITDKWLQDALNTRVEIKGPKVVSLQLPIILKTLQRLRTTNNTHLYFKLMKRLNSTKINWVTTNYATSIKEQYEDNIPPEFYHELSSMLYKISLRLRHFKDEDDINALSKFTLNLISQYIVLLEKRKTKLHVNFWKNVISVILKSKSLIYKEEILTLIKRLNLSSEEVNFGEILKEYTNLYFYLETDQLLELENYVKGCLVLKGSDMSGILEESQLKIFSPLLVRTLQKYIMCGMEESYDHLAKLMVRNFSTILDEHDIATIDNLCKNEALTAFSTYLGLTSFANEDIAFDTLRESLLIEQGSFLNILRKLQENNIDPYSSTYLGKLDFVLFKVEGKERPRLEHWEKEFPPILSYFANTNTPLPIKKFFVNTLMQHLVGDRYVGYVIAVLQTLYVRFKFDVPLGECQEDYSLTSTGFHPLFKLIEHSSYATMCSFRLFEHMLKLQKNGKFKFQPEDFNYLFISASDINDNMLFNYYLLHYLELYGHQNCNVETKDWVLPDKLIWITKKDFKFGISEESLEIIKNVYVENGGKQLTQDNGGGIYSLFSDDKYKTAKKENKNQTKPFKSKLQDVLRNSNLTKEGYSTEIDFRYADSLANLLEYIEPVRDLN